MLVSNRQFLESHGGTYAYISGMAVLDVMVTNLENITVSVSSATDLLLIF